MLYATRKTFKKLYSIELNKTFHELAKNRLDKFDHISLFQGDSSKVLPELLSKVSGACLFWLDAHYSGGFTSKGKIETPIIQELDSIFNHSLHDHVILIDDAKMFVGEKDYPTIEQLKSFINRKNNNLTLSIKHDVIRIHEKIKK